MGCHMLSLLIVAKHVGPGVTVRILVMRTTTRLSRTLLLALSLSCVNQLESQLSS